jgi:hypothetical protein
MWHYIGEPGGELLSPTDSRYWAWNHGSDAWCRVDGSAKCLRSCPEKLDDSEYGDEFTQERYGVKIPD